MGNGSKDIKQIIKGAGLPVPPTSEVKKAGHQARNDMQRAGEPMPKRDLSKKKDVPSKPPKPSEP